jgi:hypothetical protein
MFGCGRLDFGRSVAGDANSGVNDAPPVPSSICGVYRFPMVSAPQVADLTTAPVTDGYAVFWVDASVASTVHGAVIGLDHQLARTAELPAVIGTALGGLADVGEKLVLASSNGADETLWIVGRDLGTATPQTTLSNRLMGHDPFPSGLGAADRIFVTGNNDQLEISLVASDGTIGTDRASQFSLGSAISDLSCANGPDRSHCAWIRDPSLSVCFVADVNDMGGGSPVVGTPQILSLNCSQIRTASGPAAADSALTVWRNVLGEIVVEYVASTGNIGGVIDKGSAPKVRFDGTRFWIAWLDSGGELRLTSFGLDGTATPYALPGWRPAGPEAFELVNNGAETALVLLSTSELDFLTICT